MASQTLLPTPIFPSSSKHGFFKTFPRELRDSIYELLFEEVEHDHRAYYIRLTIPLVTTRLTCRQFKLEYDERCAADAHTSRLLVNDSAARLSRCYSWAQIPALADHTTHMTVVLKACTGVHWESNDGSCGTSNLNLYHGGWIHDLARRMVCLRWLHVYLRVPKDSCVRNTLMSLERLTANPQVMRVEVLRPGCEFVEGGNEGNVLAVWTREDGLKQDDHGVRMCVERARCEW